MISSYKARCVLRGDLQEEVLHYDREDLYAPFASHESIRALFFRTASENCYIEGCDVANTYLFGDIDIPTRKKQPKNSAGIL